MKATVDQECQRSETRAESNRGLDMEFWRLIHKLTEFTMAEFEAMKKEYFARGGTITYCTPGMQSDMTSISFGHSRARHWSRY